MIYALDGKYYKQMVSAVIARFYSDGLISEAIVVTIDNDNRIRAYTPTPHATSDVPSGKADVFLNYIEKELISLVDSNYQTSEFRIFEGHSLGDYFRYIPFKLGLSCLQHIMLSAHPFTGDIIKQWKK